MKSLSYLFLFALLLIPVFVAPAAAQDDDLPEMQTYDPTHMGVVNKGAEDLREQKRRTQVNKGFVTPDKVQVTLVKPDYLKEDGQFALISVPDVVSGCFEITPLEYEAKFIDPYYLDIKIKRYRRVSAEGDDAKNCKRQNKMSTALVVLDKKDLMKRGTKQIRLSTSVAGDAYTIKLDDSHIELIPQSQLIFVAQNLTGPLKDRMRHDFIGGGIVVLHVPMAKKGENIRYQIYKFAASQGLAPTGEEGLKNASGQPLFSFYDRKNTVLPLINQDGYAKLGQIGVDRPYDGPQGRGLTAVPLSVFAARPGTEL